MQNDEQDRQPEKTTKRKKHLLILIKKGNVSMSIKMFKNDRMWLCES